MAEIPAGTRVQIHFTLLSAEARAPGLPADTAAVPYQVRARGLLVSPAALGGAATVRTATGRLIDGEFELVEPADTHTYGRPASALLETIAGIEVLKQSSE